MTLEKTPQEEPKENTQEQGDKHETEDGSQQLSGHEDSLEQSRLRVERYLQAELPALQERIKGLLLSEYGHLQLKQTQDIDDEEALEQLLDINAEEVMDNSLRILQENEIPARLRRILETESKAISESIAKEVRTAIDKRISNSKSSTSRVIYGASFDFKHARRRIKETINDLPGYSDFDQRPRHLP